MPELPPLICKCGIEFIPKRKDQVYHSKACRLAHFKTTILIRLAPIIKCPHCQQEIDLKQLKEKE